MESKLKKEKQITERIIDELVEERNYINSQKELYREQNEKFGNKMLGNAIANILRRHIENIINYYGLDYSVSSGNDFIEGIPTEWDLIIYKKGSTVQNGIIKPENVSVVIEFKTSGNVDTKYKQHSKTEFLKEQYDKKFEYIKCTNNRIKFAYISFSMVEDWYNATKEYFDNMNGIKNTVFAFLEDKALDKGNIIAIDDCNDFESYILNLLEK